MRAFGVNIPTCLTEKSFDTPINLIYYAAKLIAYFINIESYLPQFTYVAEIFQIQ